MFESQFFTITCRTRTFNGPFDPLSIFIRVSGWSKYAIPLELMQTTKAWLLRTQAHANPCARTKATKGITSANGLVRKRSALVTPTIFDRRGRHLSVNFWSTVHRWEIWSQTFFFWTSWAIHPLTFSCSARVSCTLLYVRSWQGYPWLVVTYCSAYPGSS